MPAASNPSSDRDEFFIGYEPPMPTVVARFVRRAVIVVASGVVVWALALGPAHRRLDGGTFEFGHPDNFSGTIIEFPVPALRPDGTVRRRGHCWSRRASMGQPVRCEGWQATTCRSPVRGSRAAQRR